MRRKYAKTFTLLYTGWVILFLLFLGCASPSMPVGGPKDITPPKVVFSSPMNYNTGFSEKNITLTFNEFFTLDSPNSEILFSPPLNGKPTYKVRGYDLIIDLKDTSLLAPNTSYSIFFGNSIRDLNEGNILENFNYIFSTGDHLDSLSIHGSLYDAETLEEPEDVFVMLYENNNDTIPFDSLPFYVPPAYICRSVNGRFALQNLKGGDYKIFALADENGNYTYDYPSESIAFLDTDVKPSFASYGAMIPDSINPFIMNTLPIIYAPGRVEWPTINRYGKIEWESLGSWIKHFETMQRMSSKVQKKDTLADFHTIDLFMFVTTDSTFKYVDFSVIDSSKIEFYFTQPPDSLSITLLTPEEYNSEWYLQENSTTGDTITLWISERPADTLSIAIDAAGMDTDTLEVALIKPSLLPQRRRRKKDTVVSKPKLGITIETSKAYFKKNFLVFNAPLDSIKETTLPFIANEDTGIVSLRPVDALGMKSELIYEFEANSSYTLTVPDSTFWDIFGYTQDSLEFTFNTSPLERFGSLILNLELPNFAGDFIIQLLNKDMKVMEERTVIESGRLDFGYILPDNYTIRVIYDRNKNGKWDSGDYMRKIQPERVNFYQKSIELRGNWLIEEEWKIPTP